MSVMSDVQVCERKLIDPLAKVLGAVRSDAAVLAQRVGERGFLQPLFLPVVRLSATAQGVWRVRHHPEGSVQQRAARSSLRR